MNTLTQGSPAPALPHIPETEHELQITISRYSYTEYVGTRAALESEGILPEGIEWPTGYDDLRWQDGQFNFWLRRQRPAGAKGPRKQFIDCDWWCLRWSLINRPLPSEQAIQTKAKELADAIYAHSDKGRAAWSRYWEALDDKRFQDFKATIPGLCPVKRGRRASSNTPGE